MTEHLIGIGTRVRSNRRLGRVVAASIGGATWILAGCGGGSETAVQTPSTAVVSQTPSNSTKDTTAVTAVQTPSTAAGPRTSPESTGDMTTADTAAQSPSTAAGAQAPDESTGDTTTADTAPADSPGDIGDPCRWLTVDEAEAALGVVVAPPVTIEIPDSTYGPGGDCAYHSVDEPAGPASVHVAILGTRFPRDLWDQAQRAEGSTAVAGIGELAYFDGDNKLDVFDLGRWIQVQVINPQVNEDDGLVPLLSDLARNAVERA